MSIFASSFKRSVVQSKARDEEEDLLVFGYACKLYRDDAKALMEDSGQLLIPWMGDHSLMIDRYMTPLCTTEKCGGGYIIFFMDTVNIS